MAGTVKGGQSLTSALLGVPTWTAGSLLNSWVNTGAGAVAFQYRKWRLLNEVEVIGDISSGTITNGTNIASGLPAPASLQQCNPVIDVSGTAAAPITPALQVDTSGNLKVEALGSGTTRITFHFWYSLDA